MTLGLFRDSPDLDDVSGCGTDFRQRKFLVLSLAKPDCSEQIENLDTSHFEGKQTQMCTSQQAVYLCSAVEGPLNDMTGQQGT